MGIIVFVRHGESESNVSNTLNADLHGSPLSSLGASQAKDAAEELSKLHNISALFSSPVLRAKQTAEILSGRLGIDASVDDRLRERGMGGFNHMRFESAAAMNTAFIEEAKTGYPHGVESWESLKARVTKFMQGTGEGLSIAVSHRDPIAAALGCIQDRYDDDTIPAEALKIPTASITALDADSREILSVGASVLPQGLLV